jgi:hypothetical protein
MTDSNEGGTPPLPDPSIPDSSIPNPSMNGIHADVPDGTLAGYFREHQRPPAFQGCDGSPYSVAPETEKTADLRAPYEGFLVFPRWAETGVGIMGHLESPTLVRGTSREAVLEELGTYPLTLVQAILDEVIRGTPTDPPSEAPCDPPSTPPSA